VYAGNHRHTSSLLDSASVLRVASTLRNELLRRRGVLSGEGFVLSWMARLGLTTQTAYQDEFLWQGPI